MANEAEQNIAPADDSIPLDVARTRASYERTMMSWIRTSTSLITFGFTIYKFFQLEGLGHPQPNWLIGPREFALILVSIGMIALALATLEHRQNIRALGARYRGSSRSLSVIVAASIAMLGIVALVAVIFRE
ncbi:MAG TPA: DUF202 domain-containing protein [Candidatus Binataceae bacterium]|nr:DUF202 domain-containing protein [Candidatus Binataceae bacterium]